MLKEGEYFSQLNLATSYERLVSLNLFSNVGIEIKEVGSDLDRLDIFVSLKTAPKFDFVWQPQIISRNSDLIIVNRVETTDLQTSFHCGIKTYFTMVRNLTSM